MSGRYRRSQVAWKLILDGIGLKLLNRKYVERVRTPMKDYIQPKIPPPYSRWSASPAALRDGEK